MPSYDVETPQRRYSAVVERGVLERAADWLPPRCGKIFVVSEPIVWRHHGEALSRSLAAAPHQVLFLPGGEEQKRLAPLECLAEEMARSGADRTSVVVAFGGGIVNDMGGFLASVFMRGIPVLQIPTTLLAQVDAGVGGKTGVNLACGKNLVGTFWQPLAVLADPAVLETLPEREYRAGLYEVIKAGIIREPALFDFLEAEAARVLAREPGAVERLIADSVRMKAEVVSADEREGGLRRILNFGHTFGHALEAETAYARFLHGEAVAFGMRAAIFLARASGLLRGADAERMLATVALYGPIPALTGIRPENLFGRLAGDKKTVQGKVHFVLPEGIGRVRVATGYGDAAVMDAIRAAFE